MAYQDLFAGKRLTLSDFTQDEIDSLTPLVNDLYNYVEANPVHLFINSRPSDWNDYKSRIYICYVATENINDTLFSKISAINKFINIPIILYDTNEVWDSNTPYEA